MPKSIAPWTVNEVHNILRWQTTGSVHEFTCAHNHEGSRVLKVYTDALRCPTCSYTQNWVQDFVALEGPPKNPFLKEN